MPGAWGDARARHPFPERAAETRPRVMMPAGPGMGSHRLPGEGRRQRVGTTERASACSLTRA